MNWLTVFARGWRHSPLAFTYMSSVSIAWCYFWTDMLHWLQTTAHVCATLLYNRKRKKISINFLHTRIFVFRSARKFLFLVPLTNWLLMLAVQPPWILQQYCPFWTFGRVRVQKETRARRIGATASLTSLWATCCMSQKTREKYCMDLDIRLLLPR